MNLKDIFFVIVLYKSSLKDSKTINSLVSIIGENITLFVFDNSPIRQYENDKFQFKNFIIHYHHDETNPGLSVAYNLALEECSKLNKKWLLLLDQDTAFTKKYIKEIESLDFNTFPDTVVAIIPRVVSLPDERIIAPVKMFLGGICRPTDVENGVIKTKISGINSGTLLNVFYMNSINGFSENYTLDMLDHWYFRKLFKNGKSVYLMESHIYQELSICGSFEENVSFIRYQQMLKSESLFIKEEGMLSLLIFKFRLIFRVLKQFKYKNSDYYKFTLKQVFFIK
jgi:glycosyltransferase involved in cell wall biosynthesis